MNFFRSITLVTCFFVYCFPANASSITFNLWGYTDNTQTTPRFDCEGSDPQSFPFSDSNVQNIGTMGKSDCTMSTSSSAYHRDFHLQSISPSNTEQKNIMYKINTITGGIEGSKVGLQTAVFFTYNSSDYVMNYGVSHAAPPVTDQAYIYTGHSNSTWMGDLTKTCPNLKICDLVLPGSHDAGMYEINVSDLDMVVKKICGKLGSICEKANTVGLQLVKNVSLTQKDTANDQLKFGTRFFDFRPAYDTDDSRKIVYHVHNFIPGVKFDTFLSDIDTFLEDNPSEIVFIQITSSGIDTSNFTPLTKSQVGEDLKKNITKVGYDLTTSIDDYNDELITDVVKKGKRLIVVFDKNNVKDSYNDKAYSASLTDPKYVIDALTSTIQSKGNFQYMVLQLQDTGSAALINNLGNILNADNLLAWGNDLVVSETGNLLQATKPIFDNHTYQWLIATDTLDALYKQTSMVVLLNDFVESALSSHAIGLTKSRYQNRAIDKK